MGTSRHRRGPRGPASHAWARRSCSAPASSAARTPLEDEVKAYLRSKLRVVQGAPRGGVLRRGPDFPLTDSGKVHVGNFDRSPSRACSSATSTRSGEKCSRSNAPPEPPWTTSASSSASNNETTHVGRSRWCRGCVPVMVACSAACSPRRPRSCRSAKRSVASRRCTPSSWPASTSASPWCSSAGFTRSDVHSPSWRRRAPAHAAPSPRPRRCSSRSARARRCRRSGHVRRRPRRRTSAHHASTGGRTPRRSAR